MLELGSEGKDKISGFQGIITARHQYITGCDQYTLSGKMIKEGEIGESYQFDEGRIEITGRGILPEEVKTKITGGPQPKARIIK